MTREEKKALQEQLDKDFLEKKVLYTEQCFDQNNPAYHKMESILDRASERPLTKEVGYELHHRIPRSFFKKINIAVVDNNNLYKLTYMEHFLVHYYAYICATSFMKPAMSLALLEMKKMCTKVDGFLEEDAIFMANLFNNIKWEIFGNKSKDHKKYTLKYFEKQLKDTSINLKSIYRSVSNTDIVIKGFCEKCGKSFLKEVKINEIDDFLKEMKEHVCEK